MTAPHKKDQLYPTDFDGTAPSMVTPTRVRHRNEER
jgi:hypothetical protein